MAPKPSFTNRTDVRALTGAVVLLVAVLVVAVIYKAFRGDFSDSITVSAEVGQAGDSLTDNDIVTYREVIVGQVLSYEATGTGGARLRLRIAAPKADQIPAGVTAIAVPASLFGSTKIVLIAPKVLDGPHLADGNLVPADTSPSSNGLQTALSDLYTLLTAVRPAELNSALTALATALDGRGEQVGRLIDQAAGYLRAIAPTIPQLRATIRSLATVTQELSRNSPALLDALSNALTPAAAIVRRQKDISELLSIAPGAADNARALIDRVGDDFVTVVSNAAPVLQAIDENPGSLARTVLGFRNVGQALNSIVRNGRAQIDIVVAGANTAALVAVIGGQRTDVADGSADPRGYTTADCPRYIGAAGPNCRSAAANSERAIVLTSGRHFSGRVGGAGSEPEQQIVTTVAGRLAGVSPKTLSAPVADLILGPLLRGTPLVLK